MPGERVIRLLEVEDRDCPYFAIVMVHGQGRRPELQISGARIPGAAQ